MLITNLASVFEISQYLVSCGLKNFFGSMKDTILRKRPNENRGHENESPFETPSFGL
jgi:hypothetical protein